MNNNSIYGTNLIAILTIGSEVLDGRVQDTNSNYICKRMSNIGVDVTHVLSCTDKLEDIKDLITFARKNCNILIISGGLGPTSDDLTREAVAEFTGQELVLRNDVLENMKALYKRRGREFNPINTKQAYFPKESIVVPNPVGTAAGFLIEEEDQGKNRILFSLPGVPVELKAMFEETVEPYIQKLKGIIPLKVKGYKCFGLPEAVIGAKIESLKIPPEIFVSYRASFPEVHIALKSRSALLDEYYKKCIDVVGEEYIFTKNLDLTYEELIIQILADKNLTLSTAESCTAGLLSSFITNVPGSSKVYLGTVVSYANEVKEKVLQVKRNTLLEKGAVSAETAMEMAENSRALMNSDLCLSITGIAGPDGGNKEKPVGLFYIGISDGKSVSAHRFFIPLKRKQIRLYACYAALDVLRRHIFGLDKLPDSKIPD